MVVNWPRSVERPEDNVIIFKSELTTSGHIKPPYAKTAVKMVRAATEVPVSGNICIRQTLTDQKFLWSTTHCLFKFAAEIVAVQFTKT